VKTLRRTYTDESDLKVAALNKMRVKHFQESLRVICQIRKDYVINFGRAFCDMMICLNENDLPRAVFGIRMNDGVEGAFGIASALLYLLGL
jgi:hypothetical protein